MSNCTDSNVLFARHLPEMRSYLQLDGFALHLVQRGLLTERDVIFLHALEGGDLQFCHLVRMLKKTRNAFESFVKALEDEVASDYSANAHGHRQLLDSMRGSLDALQSTQQFPRSRSGSLQRSVLDQEADASSRSPSPFSAAASVRRLLLDTAVSDGSATGVSRRQSQSPSVSREPSPLPRSDSPLSSISTADSLKVLGDLAYKVLSENREIRQALECKSRECEELRQELAKVRAMRPTRIPVPLRTPSEHSWSVSEGNMSADPKTVVQSRGLQRPSTAAPSLRAEFPRKERKGPSKLPPILC